MNIKHVKGNLLRLAIPLTIITKTTDGGQETSITEDFIPNINYPITVRLGGSYLSYSFDATMDGNIAIMEDNGTLPKGVYQVEVLCKDDNGNNCRFMQRSVIDVVDATIEAGIVIGTEFEVETHYLDAAVFIRGEKGDMGRIGKISISVDNTTRTPSATATAAKAADGRTDISFSFKGIMGE